MGVGPIILLGNPLPDSRRVALAPPIPAGEEDGGASPILPVWKEENREADFREESVLAA